MINLLEWKNLEGESKAINVSKIILIEEDPNSNGECLVKVKGIKKKINVALSFSSLSSIINNQDKVGLKISERGKAPNFDTMTNTLSDEVKNM